MIARPGRQVRDLLARSFDPGLSILVGKAHDRVGVGDVEMLAHQRHSERRIQTAQEDDAHVHDAVPV
jgi:hypothetical protein